MVCDECDGSALYAEPSSHAYQETLELGLNAGDAAAAQESGISAEAVRSVGVRFMRSMSWAKEWTNAEHCLGM